MKKLLLSILLIVVISSARAQNSKPDSVIRAIEVLELLNDVQVIFEGEVRTLQKVEAVKFNDDCTISFRYYKDWNFIDKKESEIIYTIPLKNIQMVSSKKSGSPFRHSIIVFESVNGENNIFGKVVFQKNSNPKDNKEDNFKTTSIGVWYEGEYLIPIVRAFNLLRQYCNSN